MKKKVISIALIIALIAVIAAGSFAYFTDTKSAKNTFTVGDVKIKLDETNINDPTGDRVTSNEYTSVFPGVEYKKDPIVTNTGKNDAYVRAVVTIENGMNWLGFYYDKASTFPQVDAFEKLICNTLGEGWEVVGFKNVLSSQTHPTSDTVVTLKYTGDGDTGVLKSGAATTAMFDRIMLPAKMTATDITTRVAQNGVFHIDVVAQAIQADGFETWDAAFAAFDQAQK